MRWVILLVRALLFSFSRHFPPLIRNLQLAVEIMRVRQNIVVLQASEDDAGGDADLLGEGDDVGARESPPLDERLQCGRRNELVAR